MGPEEEVCSRHWAEPRAPRLSPPRSETESGGERSGGAAMDGQRPCSFPLLVRGDWGPAEPSPALRKKLLCYFQSQKRSGGGECELRTGTDTGTGHILLCFACPEVRERVLRRPLHELVWGSRERLSLQVTALPADGGPAQDAGPAGGTEAPVNELQVSLPICQDKETPVCSQQEKTEPCEKLEAEKATSKNSAVVVTTAFGEEIEDEILEMYFENKKKSGGGPIESCVKKDQQVIITFQDEQDAQEVLQRKHRLSKIDLVVKPWQVETSQESCKVENSEGSLLPTAVVLENVKETTKDCMLIMLVENISGLSEDDGDFSVEMIPELCAAVVTFTGNTDAEEFAKKLNENPRARKQNITARCLEQTKSVRAENIPPNTPSHYITVYFENEKYGGAQTVDVQQLPDEDAAIITFGDQKDVTNILAKEHSLNKTPIFVYPYYTSLETALYGKEGPQIKKPDPVTLPLDPYIWNYLQRNSTLIEAIDHEMAKCNCVPVWPDSHCADPKVTLHPSAIFSERKRSVSRLVKAWKENVSTAFSNIISKYEAIQCQVSTEVWEAIRNSFPHDEVLMIPHISEDLHILVGEKEVVKKVEQELWLLIKKATREIEREKLRTELEVKTVSPGEYGLLQDTGLVEKFHTEFPDLQITYDYLQKSINLSGVPEEVYKVKGEILDHVHKMAKKTINIHPYIFQFLQHIDNETLSQSLFISKQISAFYELAAGEIILKGNTPEDLLKAEEEVKKELDYKSIALEDESILQKEEWQMLAKKNCCNGAVAVTQAETQIMIAGLSEAVAKAFEELYTFVDENTQMQKVIEKKAMALVKFFEKEKVDDWAALQKKGVKIDFSTQKNCGVISLTGPKTKVLEGVKLVEQILSGLHFKLVVIDLPGAKAYIKEQEPLLAAHMKQIFNCLVLLEEQPEEQLQEQKEHGNRGKLYMQVTMGETVIALYKADLCTHPVDVVVNASNEDLKHIGGLAAALSRAAGPALQEECDELVRRNGNLEPGCAVITCAGKLPCKNVIHAVGPRWSKEKSEMCVDLLRKTVKNCLQLAETHKHRSIALPAISGGIFGFPLELCTYSIVSSIKETLEESKENSSLKEVRLVGFSQDNIQAFRKAFREVFSDSPSYRSPYRVSPVPQQRKTCKHTKNFPSITTQEGLNIVVQTGSIEDATTSIVVVSVGRDLQLDKGPLGRALLSKAGPMLQADLKKEGGGRTAEDGSVLKTKGYNLPCNVVLHAVVPAWSQKNAPSKVLGDIITKCLEIAEELALKSITFPAIGTGNLEFPRSVVAKLLFDKVFEFSSKNRVNSLEEVHFLLHTKDTANIQEFSGELENRSIAVKVQKPSPNDASPSTAFSASSSTSAHNVSEMTIGSVVFRVEEGDITKEEVDAIVNITNQTFNLKIGVSRAILNGAGKAVEFECAVLAQQNVNKYIITQAGNLPCKKIIHVVNHEDIRSLVSQVLQECHLQQYTSVAFPAIGTGEARRNPAEVADSMIDAVTDFAKRNSDTSVKTIKVVIFQPHLMSVFQASMQKREKSTATRIKAFVSKAYHMSRALWSSEKHSPKEKTKVVSEKKIDLAVVQICGENKNKVEEAEKWLRREISKEHSDTEIVDESISHFGEEECEKLDDLEKMLKIKLDLKNTSIEISGVTKDVWKASSTVQKMILRVKAAKETEAKLLQNSIEWKYFEKDSYVPFNSLTNVELENAYKRKQKTIEVTISEQIYTVDMECKTAVDAQGRQIPIIRVDKSEDLKSTVLPPTWDHMENERLKIVELKPDSREYMDVQERFLQSCQFFKIEKIERVQNLYFWKNYQIKKCEMDKKNGNKNNERLLFHGTSQESLTFINNYGFNRSYAGMHAANFGNGTYFAVNAKYSANDLYSKPDANGKKYMYLARVLVGEYSLGKKGSVTPAQKNSSNSVDLFDSSTDNMNQPSMFIIFNDIQAYPEYLITFTK
ncbi:protein mono-ADP-ribosyltransferase PARP14-like [Prinia subflava]|uniref:protein mono-ADP-ribosyltransferase PARP14-like n=1 Tax=Prinia subflava TaxID=208062 RepID=UPI002FE22650